MKLHRKMGQLSADCEMKPGPSYVLLCVQLQDIQSVGFISTLFYYKIIAYNWQKVCSRYQDNDLILYKYATNVRHHDTEYSDTNS